MGGAWPGLLFRAGEEERTGCSEADESSVLTTVFAEDAITRGLSACTCTCIELGIWDTVGEDVVPVP